MHRMYRTRSTGTCIVTTNVTPFKLLSNQIDLTHPPSLSRQGGINHLTNARMHALCEIQTVVPLSLKSASYHPQNRFNLFHSLSPCLTITILYLDIFISASK